MNKKNNKCIVYGPQQQTLIKRNGFFDKYGAYILLASLISYVILLAIGTFAELFKIQAILDWWIWSPPGRQ